MAAMMNGNYTLCRDVNFKFESPICQVVAEYMGDPCNYTVGTFPALPACSDGTWNKTCYPVYTPGANYQMNCVCQSLVPIPDDVKDTEWTALEGHNLTVDGVYSCSRRLMMEGGECIREELFKMRLVVSGYGLPDSVFSASSVLAGYTPHMARIDNYFYENEGWKCSWIPLSNDTDSWLDITLPHDYSIYGYVFNQLCDSGVRVAVVTVSTSYDGVTWQIVADEEAVLWDADEVANIWLSRSYVSRFWRMYVIDKNTSGNVRVKTDLIGSPR